MERITAPTDNPWRIITYAAEEHTLTGRTIFQPRELAAIDPCVVLALPMKDIRYISFDGARTVGAVSARSGTWIWYPARSQWISTGRP